MTLPKVFSKRSLYKHGAKFFISQCSRRIGWPDARRETGAGFLAPSNSKSLSYLEFRSLLISHLAKGPLRHERGRRMCIDGQALCLSAQGRGSPVVNHFEFEARRTFADPSGCTVLVTQTSGCT